MAFETFLASARFAPGSAGHAVVVGCALVAVALVVGAARQYESRALDLLDSYRRQHRFARAFAVALLAFWLADLAHDAWPARASWANSLPLHLCDLTGLVAPAALVTGRRPLRVILHYWGLAFSTMAFVSPVVRTGVADPAFWIYWLTHGGIVAAAAYDVLVLGFRPSWGDGLFAVKVTTIYAAVVAPLDGLLGANYGYVGDTARARESLVAAFGPWPGRVPLLALAAAAMMAALTAPWEFAALRRARTDARLYAYQIHPNPGVSADERPATRAA